MKAKKCTECGLCKNACPVYRAAKRESVSPRGKAMLIKQDVKHGVFYGCTLCKACEVACPLNLDLGLKEWRVELVKSGIETEAGKKMIENVRQYGNPFGKVEKGKVPKDLYCC
ncbi:MAG: (Fe-S)-binding protein [archaeon]